MLSTRQKLDKEKANCQKQTKQHQCTMHQVLQKNSRQRIEVNPNLEQA